MVTPRRTQEQRSAETQRLLKDATIDSLVANGYGGSSTTQICRLAGVSRGAQLHHYPAKADLMAAAVDHLFQRRHSQFLAALEDLPSGDAATRFRAALGILWDVHSGGTLQAWMELVIAGRSDPELRRRIQDVEGRFLEQATQTCAGFVGSSIPQGWLTGVTRMVLSFFDGLALNLALGGDDETRQVARAVFETLVTSWIESMTDPTLGPFGSGQ